jgi:hypothetical protein
MKYALQVCGTAVLIVVLTSVTFANDGVLIGDRKPPEPPSQPVTSQDSTAPGLVETAARLLMSLLLLP